MCHRHRAEVLQFSHLHRAAGEVGRGSGREVAFRCQDRGRLSRWD